MQENNGFPLSKFTRKEGDRPLIPLLLSDEQIKYVRRVLAMDQGPYDQYGKEVVTIIDATLEFFDESSSVFEAFAKSLLRVIKEDKHD